MTFVSSDATQGTYDNVTGIWTVGTVAPAATATLTIAVTVDKTNTIVNTATVDGDQFDPIPANNTDSSPVKAKEADLLLLKTVSDPTPNVGDQITFTVALFNSGPDTADGGPGDRPLADRADLRVGHCRVRAPTTTSPGCGTWARWRRAAGADAGDRGDGGQPCRPDQHGDHHRWRPGRPQPRQQQQQRHRDAAAGRPGRDQDVSDATPNVGDIITFTVTLTNQGPNTATGVAVTDLLPPGLSSVSDPSPGQGPSPPRCGTWARSPPVRSSTLTIIARVDSPIAQTNTATVTTPTSSTRTRPTTAPAPPRRRSRPTWRSPRSVSDATPNVGDQITFTVTLTNSGPDTATA